MYLTTFQIRANKHDDQTASPPYRGYLMNGEDNEKIGTCAAQQDYSAGLIVFKVINSFFYVFYVYATTCTNDGSDAAVTDRHYH